MPEIVNKELYYALKNRIHRFNWRYGDRLKHLVGEKGLLTEDIFEDLRLAWTVISIEHTDNDSAKSLDKEQVISEEHFKKLKDAVSDLRQLLCSIAASQKLGEVYTDADGVEKEDFTYVSQELFEICMFAVYTYTNFFQQCKYMKEHHFEREQGPRRAKELARTMHPGNQLRTFEIDKKSQQMLDNPLDNVQLEIARHLHTEDNYTISFNETNERPPYYEVKKKNDEYRQKNYDEINKKIADKKEEKEQEIVQNQIRNEQKKAEWEEEIRNRQEDFSSYEQARHNVASVPNENPPSKLNEHFYALFATLDIDESDLTAQTLIDTMRRAHLETKDDLEHYNFFSKVAPLYRQVQALAYEASIKNCIEIGAPINLNSTVKRVDDVMAALYYTVNPTGFNKGDLSTRIRVAELLNGTYMTPAERKIGLGIRKDALKYVKEQCKAQGIEKFSTNAEAIYASFTDEGKSSGEIARDTVRSAVEYTRYMAAVENGTVGASKHDQERVRNEVMDNAYALEKRIETRYASRWSRFWRFLSYRAQSKALQTVKASLGIDRGTRVADVYLDDRLNRMVKDFSDPERMDEQRLHYTEKPEMKSLEHVKAILQLNLLEKKLPQVELEDEIREIEKLPHEEPVYEDKGHDLPNDIKTIHGEYLKEKEREEEEKRQEEERLKSERLEKERLEREKAEEEERKQRAQEEEKKERERRALAEKERLYAEKVSVLENKIHALSDKYDRLAKEEREENQRIDERIKEITNKVSDLEEEQENISMRIKDLSYEASQLMELISQKVNDITTDSLAMDVTLAEKEAKKGAGKSIKEQSLENAKKVSEYLENDPVIKQMRKALEEKNKEINQESESLAKNKEAVKALWSEEKKLAGSKKSSVELRNMASELKELKEELKYLQDHKDDVIHTGERIGFYEALLFADEDLQANDDIMRPSYERESYQSSDGRYTVIVDEASEDSDLPVSARVDEDGKEIQKGISKI